MLIDVVNGDYDVYGYLQNGGKWFLELDEVEQSNYAILLDQLPVAIEIETKRGLVDILHAQCPVNDWNNLNKELNRERKDLFKDICLWDRTKIENNLLDIVDNIYQIFVGHTPLREVAILGNTVFIDTGAVFGNKLTILEI